MQPGPVTQPSEATAQGGLWRLSRPSRKPRTLGQSQTRVGLVFITPVMFLFAIFVILPAVTALYLSFTEYDILRPARWVGLENYRRLLDDSLFHRGLRNVTL
jgi:multiple sugar transport system permease protein